MSQLKCGQPQVGSISILAGPTLTEASKAMEMHPVLHQDTYSTHHPYFYFMMFPGDTDCLRQVEFFFHNQINQRQWFPQSSV